MKNELLIIVSLAVIFCSVLPAYRFFGKSGLYCMTSVFTVLANIEVLIIIKAFGMEQTLGNILFAATFLITDILSENEGKAAANKAVTIGIVSSLAFVIISQSWLLYEPSHTDWASPLIRTIFSPAPRLIASSVAVYAVSQRLDVWLYHKWWSITEKKLGSKRSALWLRNNGSTLISQLINSILYNILAFAGIYPASVLISICSSTYIIYVFTSLLDTPIVYLARSMKEKELIRG